MQMEEWKSQIKRGTLEFCILLLIRQKPRYGYEMISRLEKWSIVAARESTIYPLLRRLQKDGCLDSYWQETSEGLPPRKYYSITDRGREYLTAVEWEWGILVEAITDIQGGKDDE